MESDKLSDSGFLRDLAAKLMRIPPSVAGTDQGHAERCREIAERLERQDLEMRPESSKWDDE